MVQRVQRQILPCCATQSADAHRSQSTLALPAGALSPLRLHRRGFQFDWSRGLAVIRGVCVKLQVEQVNLALARAYTSRQSATPSMLFDAHNHAFRVLCRVPRRGIYDNMCTAVDKVGRGKERSVNARFSAMTNPKSGSSVITG